MLLTLQLRCYEVKLFSSTTKLLNTSNISDSRHYRRFSSRFCFLDHVNRRGLRLEYKCEKCEKNYTFYNPCSFLLHCRGHFDKNGGFINLDNIEIGIIDMNLAGFLPHPDVPKYYDVEEEVCHNLKNINVCFYTPKKECLGRKLVQLEPNELIFTTNIRENNRIEMVTLKLVQVCQTIPFCKFVDVLMRTDSRTAHDNNNRAVTTSSESEGSGEAESDQNIVGKIQVKNLESMVEPRMESGDNPMKCPECEKVQSCQMVNHFQVQLRPWNDSIKCRTCGLISPGICSLKAHMRTHAQKPPFVCPECGSIFGCWLDLKKHMDDVCFHLAKAVRYKCPAKKCGKIFAQTITFSTHFPQVHMKKSYTCLTCNASFSNSSEANSHTKIHTGMPKLNYQCHVCAYEGFKDNEIHNIKEHVSKHVKDCENRIYVYICKSCKSYYRSKQTYAAHLERCPKYVFTTVPKDKDTKCTITRFCKKCPSIFLVNCSYKEVRNIPLLCPDCSKDEFTCILCSKEFLNKSDCKNHQTSKCRYSRPIVVLNRISTSETQNQIEVRSRKRKRSTHRLTNNKIQDNQLISPVSFDGKYKCRICSHTESSKELFHDHVIQHRTISTAYQCMDCGECFVVKPSLEKHLQILHSIQNVEEYITNNDCYDKKALKELEESMRMIPGESKEPVAENQCRICRQIFTDKNELNKHFRVHGMAFLMKNIIK